MSVDGPKKGASTESKLKCAVLVVSMISTGAQAMYWILQCGLRL